MKNKLLLSCILGSCAITAEAALPWAGVEPDSSGFYDIPWLGRVQESESAWVKHEQLGLIYATGESEQSVYLYKSGAGWLWTGKNYDHCFYSFDLNDWLYYYPETSNPQWFYDYKHKLWARDLLNGEQVEDLETEIEGIVEQTDVPAIACSVVKNGKIVAHGQAGVIYKGSPTHVNANSKWVIGSITKSMTALLAARMVEKGQIQWDETLSTLLPDIEMNEQWKGVTLEEILKHTAGFNDEELLDGFDPGILTGTPPEQRTQISAIMLSGKPAWTPGTHYEYSNIGYTLAGAVLERRAGKDYEDLLISEVLNPMGLSSHGYLTPAEGSNRESQPWGHFDGTPLDPALDPGVIPVMIPAGGVILTIDDLAQYTASNLAGQQGLCPILPKNAWTELHYNTSEANQSYALGWEVNNFHQWLGTLDFSHSGCDNTFTSQVIASPAMDLCIAMSTNEGDEDVSADALYATYAMILQHYGIAVDKE